MKSSMLHVFHVFECGIVPVLLIGPPPPPHYVHLVSTWCHSRDRCSQAFLVFRALPLSCIILNANWRTKNGGGLGTRQMHAHVLTGGCAAVQSSMWIVHGCTNVLKTVLVKTYSFPPQGIREHYAVISLPSACLWTAWQPYWVMSWLPW